MSRFPAIFFSLLFIACSGPGSLSTEEPSSSSPRLPFAATPGGFSIDSGLQVRIDKEGAHASSGGEALSLHLSSWGRADDSRGVGPVAPVLGSCVLEQLNEDGCVRRVERPFDGITEWFTYGAAGLQQAWTIFERPGLADDTRPLRLRVSFQGAALTSVDRDKARLVGANTGWTYSGLRAWDAMGRELTAWMEDGRGTIKILVNDADAVFPITVDPDLAANEFIITDADATPSTPAPPWFGTSLDAAGDVNGDGLMDMIVGAPNPDNIWGSAYIFLGADDIMLPLASGSRLDYGWSGLSNSGCEFGRAVAGIGDVAVDQRARPPVQTFGHDALHFGLGLVDARLTLGLDE